jgi:hypothetical protein
VSTFYHGGPGFDSIGIWREVLGGNVYITFQYFFPAIIYRDIISHITSTYRYIIYFFRTFKKSTVPYKVHNMGLRYINSRDYDILFRSTILQMQLFSCQHMEQHISISNFEDTVGVLCRIFIFPGSNYKDGPLNVLFPSRIIIWD